MTARLSALTPPVFIEKRRSPDSISYTKQEFVAFFGGTMEWYAADEVRRSPSGMEYTKDEFVMFFGGTVEWEEAGR